MNTSTQTADRWLIRAAWAGIIGPILFFLTWVAQELFLTEGYSPLEQPVSALAAWPHGLVQTVNFVVFGLLTFAFAIGLHRGLAPSRFGIVGPALFAVTGLGLLWAAAFPLRLNAAGDLVPGLHPVGGALFFQGSALALVVTSFRLAHDRNWAPLAIPVRLAGILLFAAFPVMIFLGIPVGAPLHDWLGLVQRILILGLIFPARIALSYRLLRTGRAPRLDNDVSASAGVGTPGHGPVRPRQGA